MGFFNQTRLQHAPLIGLANRHYSTYSPCGIGMGCFDILYKPYVSAGVDGTGSVEFEHKLRQATGTYVNLTVEIQDIRRNVVQTIINHDHRSGNSNANGNPTNTNSESVGISYSGYGQVVFTWTGTNANVDAFIDDISIDAVFSSDQENEVNGSCPCRMETQDTVCGSAMGEQFTAIESISNESYSWAFEGTSGGTINTGLVSNDSTRSVDFVSTPRDYELRAVKSTTGHLTVRSINVQDVPTLAAEADTVCEGEIYTVDLTLNVAVLGRWNTPITELQSKRSPPLRPRTALSCPVPPPTLNSLLYKTIQAVLH